jgi:hypothetical protein
MVRYKASWCIHKNNLKLAHIYGNTKINYGMNGYHGREGKEDIQEKQGWKEYKQP